MDNNQPIIVKRVKRYAAGGHGGAWKIAFADFATAMMAFFLVMWLITTATPEQRAAISGYFQDPIGFDSAASPYIIDLGGSPVLAPDRTLNPEQRQTLAPELSEVPENELAEAMAEQIEQERLELLLQELQNKIDQNAELSRFRAQILLDIIPDGLRIQIVDAENRPMFAIGSAELQPYFEDILLAMADSIRQVPNKVSISGHTDATPFVRGATGMGNWELSAGRANAARRTLVVGGYPEDQVARVVGYASSVLYDRKDPFNPVNRRIDITVLTRKAQRALEDAADGMEQSKETEKSSATPGAVPPNELRERMNLFEQGGLQPSRR